MLLDIDPQQKARSIEGYLRENDLYYGIQPDPRGISSWTLATNNFELTPPQEQFLTEDLGTLISSFHTLSSELISQALSKTPPPSLLTLRKALTAGLPFETIDLFYRAIQSGETAPFSTRPDIVIDETGNMHIVEYNVDGGADKGNTEGVNHYSQLFLGEPTLGEGLASLFVRGVRNQFPHLDNLQVTTVLPSTYRAEYNPQSRYFANRAHIIGQRSGVSWDAAEIQTLGNSLPNIVDREFKLPGFTNDQELKDELNLVQSALAGYPYLLGTILPLSDKILFATLFDPDIAPLATELIGSERLTSLKSLHAETQIVDPSKSKLSFGENPITWQEIANKKTDFGMVLKRAGDTIGTTGSKGVLMSTDENPKNPEQWKQALESALQAAEEEREFWIIQKLYPSEQFSVRHLRDGNKQEKETQAAIRFAPYYVSIDGQFQLGNVLVTAGVDREIKTKTPHNIHARRDNPYLAVARKLY